MPVTEDNVGYSEHTLSKMYNFKKIAEMHIAMCKGILSRESWCDSRYFYMDLTAGTGIIPDTTLPNCANIMTDRLRELGISYQAHFIDQENTDALRSCLGISPAFYYYKADHNKVAKDIIAKYVKKPPYGLIFYDPNSPGIINGQWGSLNTIAELFRDSSQLKQVDFMMYLSVSRAG